MKKEWQIGVSTLAGLLLTAAIWTLPSAAKNANTAKRAGKAQEAPQTQSVSGKITAIEKATFTLSVTSDRMSRQSESSQGESALETMTFHIDRNTTIDGRLKVGANADVTYREEGGKNIAINVVVTS
jgi:hypothetical protein